MSKFTANEILEQSKTLTANGFNKFLNWHGISYTELDIDNIMDLNEGFYNVRIDDHAMDILFSDGEFCQNADYTEYADQD